jgi:hypothetical protein
MYKKNQKSIIEITEPILEAIFNDIINSRIKNTDEKDSILKYYKIENNNKYIDLKKFQKINKDNPYIFELNIYVIFKRGNISFFVEHWKFRIDITNSQFNQLNDNYELRIKKKLYTFFRSIKTLQKILPLNSLFSGSFDYSFQIQLYLQSNIDLTPEEEIKNEKMQIKLETKDEKFFKIQLIVNYFTETGIFRHEKNIKNYINKDYHNELYTKLMLGKVYDDSSENGENQIENINNNINNDNNDEDDLNNFSQMFAEAEKRDLFFSSIIETKIIDKKGEKLEKKDLEECKEIKKGNSKQKINLDELYESMFTDIEDINCRKSLDELLTKDILMKDQNIKLNDLKEKYKIYFNGNKLLVDELYEEMKNFEFNDLFLQFSQNDSDKNRKLIIDDNYFGEKNDNNKIVEDKYNEQNLFKDIISDYIEIKLLLNNN